MIMNDDLKIAINTMQDRIVSDCDDILLIFDNQRELNEYKKSRYTKKSNEILITFNDLVNKGLVGRRFRRYWFMTDRDI